MRANTFRMTTMARRGHLRRRVPSLRQWRVQRVGHGDDHDHRRHRHRHRWLSGDGGKATSAQLSGPNAVAVDGRGNVYVSDLGEYDHVPER